MPEMPNEIEFGVYSSSGRVRDHNEDAVLAEPELGLWVVADGMGGHSAGEVASALVAEHIGSRVRNGAGLESAIHDAQTELRAAVDRGDGPEGMGTTVVAIRIIDNRYEIAWVGDSRAYVWHDGHLRQLTHDHSFVQQLVDEGAISREEAEQHPERSTLSRCLGGGIDDDLLVDTVNGTLFAGERLILCTDGVNSELADFRIASCIRESIDESASEAARRLVEAAVDAGGHDNATAIVISAGPDAPRRIQQTAPRQAVPSDRVEAPVRRRRAALLGIAIIPIVVVLAAVVYYLGNRSHNELGGPPMNQGTGSSTIAPPGETPPERDENPEIWRSGFEKGEENESALHQ